MAYINNKTKQKGTLYELLPNVSNPTLFTEGELLERNIEKYNPTFKEPTKTLKELKEEKYKSIAKEVHDYVTSIYPYYKQLSALNGTYDEATCNEIKTFCDREVKRALSIKKAIDSATTKQQVKDIYYRKAVYAEGADFLSEPIDYVFWGE